jgi:hypothetical protein
VLSLRLDFGGASGVSLTEIVGRIRKSLAEDAKTLSALNQKLIAAGYSDEDSLYYPQRFRLADKARVISVDSGCPRIQEGMLTAVIGESAAQRVSHVTYRIDVEGLGHEEGSKEFEHVMGCKGISL